MLSKFTTDKGNTYYFEPSTYKVYNEDGTQKEFSFDTRLIPHVDNCRKNSKKQHIYRCKIQLGMACNYECKYCVQKQFQVIEPQKKDLERLVEALSKYDIDNIQLWGGEPLVYWKTLKKLLPMLREKFPNTRLSMISNGSLLDEEKVDLLIRTNVMFMMSHDGPSFKQYRNKKDPLDDPKFVNLINNFSKKKLAAGQQPVTFHSVITPENCNLAKLYEFFLQRVSIPIFSIEGICTLSRDSASRVTPFDSESIDILRETYYRLCKDIAVGETYPWFPPYRHVATQITRFLNGYNIDCSKTRCANYDDDVLIVDLEGNILPCQGCRIKAPQTVFLMKNLEDQKKRDLYNVNRVMCKDCTVLPICKQGCPIISNEDLPFYCKNMKLWSFILFSVAFQLLTDEQVVNIDIRALYDFSS